MSDENEYDTGDNGADSYEPAPAEPQQPQEAAYDAPPQSWAREAAAHWSTLPEPLRVYLHTRESEAHGRISQLGSELSRHQAELQAASQRQVDDPYENVFQHYAQYLPEGIGRDQAVAALLEVNRLLSEPATRGPAIQRLLEQYGHDPSEPYRQQLQSVKQQELQSTLEQFKSDKPYYNEAFSQAMTQEILALRQQAPGLDHASVLRLAHDRLLERNPNIKAQQEMERAAKDFEAQSAREKAQRAEAAQRAKAARKAGSINVRSTPAMAKPKSWEEDLRAIAYRDLGP